MEAAPMSREYISERLDRLIADGEVVLKGYNQTGNIDRHDLWFTEAKNFLSVNAPQFVEKLSLVAPKYSEQLLEEPYGRAAYNLIQEQLEVIKLARGVLGAPPASHVLDTAVVNDVVGLSEGKQKEVITLKPGIWGMSIDLKELGRRVRNWYGPQKQ
jgi:hypothetical protein